MSEAKENSVIATTALWDMHEFAGIRIRMRKSDGFLSATDMCKVNKKKNWYDYNKLKQTNEYFNALEQKFGTAITLYETISLGAYKGTWIHPKVAIHFAMWISPEFSVDVVEWIEKYFKKETIQSNCNEITYPTIKPEQLVKIRCRYCNTRYSPNAKNAQHLNCLDGKANKYYLLIPLDRFKVYIELVNDRCNFDKMKIGLRNWNSNRPIVVITTYRPTEYNVYLNSSRWKVLKKIYEFIQIPIGTLLSDNSMAIVNANRKELNLVNSCLSRDDDAPHEYNLKVRLGLIVEDDAEDGMEENATEETTEDTDNVESDTEDTDDVESDDNAE